MSLTEEKILDLLETYENIFIKIRYPYEKYKDMTELIFFEYGKLWVELGAPEEEAEFQYHPEKLYGFTKALQQEIESHLAI